MRSGGPIFQRLSGIQREDFLLPFGRRWGWRLSPLPSPSLMLLQRVGVGSLVKFTYRVDFITVTLVIGIMWIWIVPIIFGWYSVHTPSTRRSIREALQHSSQGLIVSKKFCNDQELPNIVGTRQGILKAVKAPLAQRETTGSDSPNQFLAWNVAGDEEEQGPFFNYARCFSWMCVARRVIDAHEISLQRNHAFNSIPANHDSENGSSNDIGDDDDVENNPSNNTANDNIDPQQSETLSPFLWEEWNEIQPAINRMINAFILAILFHAVPMMMAFVICYLTPPVGLGCCSLPVAVVFGASIVAAILLIFSTVFSTFCLRYKHRRRSPKPFGYWLSAILGAVTRTLGKTIAFLNSVALLLHCFLLFSGVYNTCYCNSSRIGLRSFAYVVFLTADEIRNEMVGIWGGCLAVTLVTLFISTFYLIESGRKLFKFSR